MRIHKVTLRNYRRHDHLEVDLAADRTLIHGPNECGKSSLIEAIHRCLFYRYKSRAAGLLDKMQPRTGGDPEVTLEFSLNGKRYTLHKKFRGSTGSRAGLTEEGTHRLDGDAAEERLLELLAVDEVRGQQEDAFNAQWAHLWVWQGSAQDEPSRRTAGKTTEQLREQLQQQEGIGVIASPRDDRLRAFFQRQAEAIFGQGNKAKKKSRLGQAEERLAAATETLRAAEDRFNASLEAAERLGRAEESITQNSRRLTEAELALEPLGRELAEAARLREELAVKQAVADNAAAALERLEQQHADIGQLSAELAEISQRIKPAEAGLEQLRSQAAKSLAEAQRAATVLEDTRRELTAVQERRDLVAAQATVLAAGREADELAVLISRLDAAQQAIDAVERELDQIPTIHDEDVAALTRLQDDVRLARARVSFTATKVELLEARQAVQLEGEPVTAGETRTITEATTISVGDGTRLVITPGGGASLAEAQADLAAAEDQLRGRLVDLGVANLAMAQDCLAKRQHRQLKRERHALEMATLLGGKSLAEVIAAERESRQRLAEAQQRAATLQQRLDGLQPPAPPPADTDELTEQAATIEADYERLQQLVRKQTEGRELSEKQQTLAEQAAQQAERAVLEDRLSLDGLRRRRELLEEQHGDEAARAERMLRARRELQAATAAVATTRQQLEQLDLPRLETDRERFERVVEQATRAMQEAREIRAAAQATLQQAGATDIHQSRAAAAADQAAAQREHEAARQEAAAIVRLRDRFTALSRERADQVAAPLQTKAAEYLAAMFGKGTQVSLSMDDAQGLCDLTVSRPEAGSHSFAFAELSGGTREQVAAALRLAMAEILAVRYGGSLPIVFDDAFTNSDPERIERLQRMLDLAASRGLQVIVLSCSPADYRMFGATEIDLVSLREATAKGSSAPSELQPGP